MSLEKKIEDIKKYISLKDTTYIGDIILVGMPSGFYYATVRDINPDSKKNWYIVRFTLLVLPPVELNWTLREPQMCGEIFTINGEEHFMAAVALESEQEHRPTDNGACSPEAGNSGNILKLHRKK